MEMLLPLLMGVLLLGAAVLDTGSAPDEGESLFGPREDDGGDPGEESEAPDGPPLFGGDDPDFPGGAEDEDEPTEGDDTLTVARDATGAFDAGAGDDSVTVEAETGSGFEVVTPTQLAWNTATAEAPLTVSGGAGDDTLLLSGSGYAVTGGEGADRIELGDATDVAVTAGAGDTVVGGTGGDSVHVLLTEDAEYQGSAAEEAVVNASSGPVDMGAGNDTVIGLGGASSVAGGEGDDVLIGTVSENAWLPSATDRLSYYTSTDADTLDGGAGDDVISASHGDLVTGGEGADTLRLFLDAGASLEPTTVTDFNPAEDLLLITFDSFVAGTTAAPSLAGQITLRELDGDTLVTGPDGQVLAVLQGTTGLSAGLQLTDDAPLTDLAGNPTPGASYDIVISRYAEVTS